MGKTSAKGAAKETPLMKQFNAIKAKYPGAILLFRVGDFYETFGEDAVRASKILDIVLTKRANGSASHIELAGFPHHALDSYLPKLVRAGNRVAICDQLEDPKSVKGIVKRGVTELVTPGLSFNDHVLDQRRNNYLASLFFGKKGMGIAFLDLSTGEFLVSEGDQPYIDKLIQGFSPTEIILCKQQREQYYDHFSTHPNLHFLEDWVYSHDYGYERLIRHFQTSSLKGFGVESMGNAITAAGGILQYLDDTEHREINHISGISRIDEDHHVWLDKFTIRNLELLHPNQLDGASLLDILDETLTPMGARLLKKWLVFPLKDREQIEERHSAVEVLLHESDIHEKLAGYLKQIGDLERMISKVAVGRINPREMVQLNRALQNTAPIVDLLQGIENSPLQRWAQSLDPCEELRALIATQLQDNPPLLVNQGNLIRDGVDAALDELRQLAFSGKDYLLGIQQRETERTGISSLKIAFNKVFGYYLEVTNAHKDKVPEEWIRKQTLVNAERYITAELKEYEEKILNAEEQIQVIEQRIYHALVAKANEYVAIIQQNARLLATLDVMNSFATIARKNNYHRPQMSDDFLIDIKEGRHPVIECQLPITEKYIPNDTLLDNQTQQILVITGPNMAGKSALLRQTALIVLMAQMGSYVPATYAKIGIVDKIFTRVGASDNLSKGESTFMVEMIETASILNNLSDRSLILMDEIGRGTSTYDGISIAWSIVEFLHQHPQCKAKTLFATHYHELNQLAADFPRIKNYNVSVKELNNTVIFLRKLKEGGSEHSFGIHVAKMAGMPNEVVIRANEILGHLESEKIREKDHQKAESIPPSNFQLSMFEADPHFEEVRKLLNAIDINTISPVEALLKLNEIKTILKGGI